MLERIGALVVAVPFVLGAASAPSGGPAQEVFRFQDPAIVESSGLVVQGGRFVTTNDSGDTGRVFAVDPADGRTVAVTAWPGAPEDVEALAPAGPGHVWVGDIGDNGTDRASISVTRLPVGATDQEVAGETYELAYPDSAVDAESLLMDPRSGRLLVASKTFFGGSLYAAPARLSQDRPNVLRELGGVLPIATDGAFFPDGKHLVLRDYGRAIVYTYPGLDEVGRIDLPEQEQGEAIAVGDDARLYISSEGVRAPVLEVPLSADLRAVVAPEPEPSESAAPEPTPPPGSREGRELPEEEPGPREPWQWLLGTVLFVGTVVVLFFAVRPVRRR